MTYSNISSKGMLDSAQKILNKCQENEKICNRFRSFWGTVNVIGGVLTAIASAVNTAFTYSDNSNLVHLTAILTTVLVACMTATNPGAREIERKNSFDACSDFGGEAENFIKSLEDANQKGLKAQELDRFRTDFQKLQKDYSELKKKVRTFG